MLASQAAAAHKVAMQLMARAEHHLAKADTFNPHCQAHCMEAARLTNAAARAMGAFNDAVLTIQRRRSGGKQVVQVIHQQVPIGRGGNAIVAGAVEGGRKARGKLGGPK